MQKTMMAKPILGGLLGSVLAAVVLCIPAALVFKFTSISEGPLSLVALGIVAVSAFTGSFIGTKFIKSKGLINGLLIGLIFFSVLLVITLIASPVKALTFAGFMKKMAICLIAGASGGILGVPPS